MGVWLTKASCLSLLNLLVNLGSLFVIFLVLFFVFRDVKEKSKKSKSSAGIFEMVGCVLLGAFLLVFGVDKFLCFLEGKLGGWSWDYAVESCSKKVEASSFGAGNYFQEGKQHCRLRLDTLSAEAKQENKDIIRRRRKMMQYLYNDHSPR